MDHLLYREWKPAPGTRDPRRGGREYLLGFQFGWNWLMMFLRPGRRQIRWHALIDLLGGHFVGAFEEVQDATTMER